MKYIVACLFACFGCTHFPIKLTPTQELERAIHIVWYESFKRVDDPPYVALVIGSALNCGVPGDRGFAYLMDDKFVCLGGLTVGDVSLVSRDNGQPLHKTSLAHELCHVRWRHDHDGDGDHDHEGPCFTPESSSYTELAKLALLQQGL